jgi:uncharacterized protein
VHNSAAAGEPVTVMIARRVEPGREREFEEWSAGLIWEARAFPGFLGAGLLRPHVPGGDWQVVYYFTDAGSEGKWRDSPQRAAWLDRADALMQETGITRLSGLETWFSLPGRTAPAPPRWKMAIVAFAAIYPISVLGNVLVVSHLPLVIPLRAGVQALLLVPTMTWVVMPWLTHLLRRWLYPGSETGAPQTRAGGPARRLRP